MSVTSKGNFGFRKPFAWSYSKLKNFDACPRRHEEIDIKKSVKEDQSDSFIWGNEVHKAMKERLGPDKVVLPFTLKQFEPLAARIEAVPGELLVEQQMAITADFAPCPWFYKDAWYRSIADVLIIQPPVALAIDYKTGKILEDYQQMALMCACIFAHYPSILAIRTEAWWVREDAITKENYKRKDMQDVWRQIWPRVEQMKLAHETGVYPPKPCGLCRSYCPVASCEYYKKGR